MNVGSLCDRISLVRLVSLGYSALNPLYVASFASPSSSVSYPGARKWTPRSHAHAPWLGLDSFGSLPFFFTISHISPSSCCWSGFSLGVVGRNLPAWLLELQSTARALECRIVLYNNAHKSHTPHQSSLSEIFAWAIRRSKNDERWCLLVSSSQGRNSKNPKFGQCHAFSSWLQLLIHFFLCDCIVCYGKLYQASTGTGLAWVCLSSRTWQVVPLLDVNFLLLVFN